MPIAFRTARDFKRMSRAVRHTERRHTRIRSRARQYPRGGMGSAGSGAWSLVMRRVVCQSGTLVEQWRLASYTPGEGVSYSSWTNSATETPPDE